MTLFIQEKGDLYRKFEEVHLQRAYTLEQMIRLVKKSGLEFVTAYDAFTREQPTDTSERIYMIAREQGK